MTSPRLRELLNLAMATVLVAVAFASVYTARQNQIESTSLTYAGVFLALFAVAHAGMRMRLPDADPWLLPLCALLSGLGFTTVYRLNTELARDQSLWIVVGVAAFLATIWLLPDYRRLEDYKYLLALAGVGLLLVTMVAGTTVSGAKLWLRFGPIQVQPGEFTKILLVVFLAAYLREKREVLTLAHRRVLGLDIPAAKHFGPLLTMAGVALGVLALMNDLGSALLLFGIFLAMLWVATGRHAYTVAGLLLFAGGSWAVYHTAGHVRERFQIWLDPWKDANDAGYQLVQTIESVADGGVFGTGLGRSLQLVGGHPLIPAAHTDGIYAVWANETGLAGAAGLLLLYLLFAYRGFKIATASADGFSKLLACGLTFTVILQAFIIVGGVTRLVPLTGITLPFVSYGGSSIVSNFIVLGLLAAVSQRANAGRT